jgi:hypothetical protein
VEAGRGFIMGELVTKQGLALAMETQTLRLTVRLGTMLMVAVTALGDPEAHVGAARPRYRGGSLALNPVQPREMPQYLSW